MITRKQFTIGALAALLSTFLALPAFGQNALSRFAGTRNAIAYAYGITQNVAPLSIAPNGGNTSTGSQTITLNACYTTAADGTNFYPLAINAPVTVDIGSNQETVTPTAVSVATPIPGQGNCTLTATFAHTHGTGTLVTSGSVGLQEAINLANLGVPGTSPGGVVAVDGAWTTYGGTNSTITSAAPFSNVTIDDNRGQTQSYWSMQPTTLTSLAVPTTLAAGTVVFTAAPVGTWANSAYYFCVTYVDALGGEGPCSATYNQTPTANYTANITSPAASTGAVGWRAYAGASYNAAYLLPVTSSACTLTTLETVMPACAIGSNGQWPTAPTTTTTLRPQPQTSLTVNLANPLPQGHTTFAYEPTGTVVPVPFQTHYGPFPAYGSLSAGNIAVLGSVNLPTGFLNTIGRTIRLTGKITSGSMNTATLPTLNVRVDWVGGTTAGAGVNTCAFEGVAVGATKTYQIPFNCTLVTNAVGATAIGTLMPDGYMALQAQDISANGIIYADSNTAAVGSLGLFAQDTLNVLYTSTTNTTAAPQLLDLNVEVLQ